MRNAPITNRKIRFALVGCGRIAKNHFDSIRQHAAHAELVDVCDTDPAALERAVQSTGAAGHASLTACEMTKWFDTNYHYIVPEFTAKLNSNWMLLAYWRN